jgi:hypothetical protein
MRIHTNRLLALSVLTAGAFVAAAAFAGGTCTPEVLSSRGGSTHIEIMSNKPWVYVSMNGSRPMHFILDAGSPFTLLNTGLPQQVGFSSAGDTTFAGGFVVKRYTPKACVRVLGSTLSNIEIGDVGLNQVSTVEGTRLEGLIGGQFFLKHVVRRTSTTATAASCRSMSTASCSPTHSSKHPTAAR